MNNITYLDVDPTIVEENNKYMMEVFCELAERAAQQLNLDKVDINANAGHVQIVVFNDERKVVRNVYAHSDVIDIAVRDIKQYEDYTTPHTSGLGEVITSHRKMTTTTYHFAAPLRDKAVIDETLRIAYAVLGVEAK